MADEPYVHIPETVSRQAQEFLRTLKDPALKAREDAGLFGSALVEMREAMP